jgi:hypothetical protein
VSGAALLALAVGGASAATTVSVAMDSAFDGGPENWTAAANEQSSPLCIEGLTCPKVTDDYRAAGGVEGSGYIETKEAGLLALGAVVESTGTWESPAFTYLGVAGQRPTKVELSLARRAQLADLLGLAGAGATYTVELVDTTTPSAPVVVTNRAPLAAAEEWKRTSTAISPTLLTKGDSYKVRIRTSFVAPATAVPAGGVGYDDVRLTASREEADEGSNGPGTSEGSGGGGGTGGRKGASGGTGTGAGGESEGSGGLNAGTKGGTGAPGSRILSTAQLRTAIASQGLAATASLHRGRLIVTGRCPKAIRGACTVRIRGMLSRRQSATSSRRAKIGAGGRHSFVVAVHPRARAKVRGRRKLLVEERVRVGKARVTLYKRVRVVRR